MEKREWTRSLWAKVVAYILIVILAIMTIGAVMGGVFAIEKEFYKYTRPVIEEKHTDYRVNDYAKAVVNENLMLENYGENSIHKGQNFFYKFYDKKGKELGNNISELDGKEDGFTEKKIVFKNTDILYGDDKKVEKLFPVTVKVYIDNDLPVLDRYSIEKKLIEYIYPMKYIVWAIAGICFVAGFLLYIFLLYSAGRRVGDDDLTPGVFSKVPLDLQGLVLLLIMAAGIGRSNIGFLAALVAFGIVFIGFSMNLAAGIKMGYWLKNTITYKIIGETINIFGASKLVAKSTVAAVFIVIMEMVLANMAFYGGFALFVLIMFNLCIIAGVIYMASAMKSLNEAVKIMVAGNLNYQVDTSKMKGGFKEHGDDLNEIGQAMTKALEERMKSEMTKTELITNVSHDIKTPLTSIVNYTDLIAKEECSNEKIKEYSQVLLRQSEKLKKLIENLVEVSKATSGNVDVYLAPCKASTLLSQAVAEYEEAINEAKLDVVIKVPKDEKQIIVDGRLMWRVLDNLMGNVCKYAQPGTRVYISTVENELDTTIVFKNTSRYPLDISPQELMERFVRGDKSRGTEGNGLGLAIASSLTEIQNGKFDIEVDGDLFKVVMRFINGK
ncbi:MAG: HAMP domain-containing sensor histidine kinase [Anaerovoracaceae bacterium]